MDRYLCEFLIIHFAFFRISFFVDVEPININILFSEAAELKGQFFDLFELTLPFIFLFLSVVF
jgi:hypothetical protein